MRAEGLTKGRELPDGMYGRQLEDLFSQVERERVLLLRYKDLVVDPHRTLNEVCRFLGVAEDVVTDIPSGNSRPFVNPSVRTAVLGPVDRAGARVGAFHPPEAWRTASKPLIGQLHQRGNPERPKLTEEQRAALREPFVEDIALLEHVTGLSYADWLTHRDGGTYHSRRQESRPEPAPAGAAR